MKLDEFVKQTLLEVTSGVVEAQKQSLVFVAPGYVNNERLSDPQFVRFDIKVVVTGEVSGGLRVWSIGDGKVAKAEEASSQITFEVPVFFQAPTELNPNHYKNKVDNESSD